MAGRREKQGESAAPPVTPVSCADDTSPADGALDFVAETPTEANRDHSLSAPAGDPESGTPLPDLLSSPGSYRLVRPAISDDIATPAPLATKSAKNPGGRVIIGVARRRQ